MDAERNAPAPCGDMVCTRDSYVARDRCIALRIHAPYKQNQRLAQQEMYMGERSTTHWRRIFAAQVSRLGRWSVRDVDVRCIQTCLSADAGLEQAIESAACQ